MKKQVNKQDYNFELKLANGRSRKFHTASEMYQWAVQNGGKMEFDFDDRSGPFLCDFFEKRRKK